MALNKITMVKRKILIIVTSVVLLGVLLSTLFYFCYFKKVVIYDLVSIEFSGISRDEIRAIKINGITPVNKKIAVDLNRKIESNDIPGSYKSIEITVPDTLVSKIISIRTTLRTYMHTFKISDLHSPVLSGNTRTYILPTEVRSEGSFLTKLYAIIKYPLLSVLSFVSVVLKIAYVFVTIFLIWYFRKFK